MRLPAVSPERYRRVTLAVLVAISVIIVTGGAVRVTGSGLGCSEWPTCEQGQVVAPLELHALIEFGNRLVTGLIAIPVGLAFAWSFSRVPRRRDLTWWSAGLVAGVAFQAVLGGVLVKKELAPALTSAHFLSSMVLVWNAVVLHRRAGDDRPGRAVPSVDAATVRFGRALIVLAGAVLVTGAVVTGAGPHAGDEHAERYDLAIDTVARVHSLVAWAFLAVALVTLGRLARSGAPPEADAGGRRLVVAILFQGAVGYAQYAAGVPPYLVIVHLAGSVLVVVATLQLHLSLFTRPGVDPDAPETSSPPAAAPLGTG